MKGLVLRDPELLEFLVICPQTGDSRGVKYENRDRISASLCQCQQFWNKKHR